MKNLFIPSLLFFVTQPARAQSMIDPPETISVEAQAIGSEATLGVLGSRSILETPYTISSYDASLMEDEQLVTANQVLRHDPALTNVSPAGGFSAFNLSFRGFPSGADAVSFYGMGPGAMFSGSLGQLYSVERLDVIKGPSAGLGGFSPNAAVGGSVNIMPKLPRDTNRRVLAVGFRERGLLSGHVDLNQTLRASTAVRLNLASEAGETFYGGRDERDVFAFSLRHGIAQNAELVIGYDQIRIKSEGYQNAFVLTPGVPVPRAPNPHRNHFQKWTYLEQEWNYGYASLDWDLGRNWNLFIQGLYGIRRRPVLSSGTGLIQNEDGDMLLRPNHFAQGTRYKPFFGGNAFLSTRLQTAAWRHRMTLAFMGNGFNFITAEGAPLAPIPSHLFRPIYTDRPPLATEAIGRTSQVEAQTVALSDDMQVTERFSILWGIKSSTLHSQTFEAETGEKTLNQEDTAATPFAAFSARVMDQTTAYLSYAKGLERGGVAPVAAANSGEILPPIPNHQIEIGLKSEAGRGILVSAALFQIERGLEYVDADSGNYVQDGWQRNRGLEISTSGRILDRFRFNAGLLLLDPRIVRNGQVQDKEAPGAPRMTLPLTLGYQLDPMISLSTSLYHFGKQFVDVDNTRSLEPWTRWDAGIKLSMLMDDRALALQLQVENAGNQRYWASAAGGQLTLGAPEIWKAALRLEI